MPISSEMLGPFFSGSGRDAAVLAVWIAWPISIPAKEAEEMLKWLLRRRIDAFEKEYDYDASRMRYILDASLIAALKFGRIMRLANYRQNVPLDASFAAALTTTLAEDCAPCSQLMVTIGGRERVAPVTIRAILTSDERAMTLQAALGYRFTQTTLQHTPDANLLRDEIVARWGPSRQSCWFSESRRSHVPNPEVRSWIRQILLADQD